VQRCLRKEVDRRAQSMADLKLALEEVKEESESGKLAGTLAVERTKSRRAIWAVSIAVLLGLAGTAFWFLRPDRTPQAALQAVPLTTYPGFEFSPSFSPDGNQVAFSWNGEKQDNFDIYVKLIGPGRPLRLTTDSASDRFPAWSPDGRSIAFVRGERDAKTEVLLIPALGGSERQIAEFPTGAYLSPAWSPDGRWLVASAKDSVGKPSAIFLVSGETGEKRQLTFPPASTEGDGYGALSPDARTLAFVRTTGKLADDVYALTLADNFVPRGEPRRLTSDNRVVGGIAWTADGRELVFSSDRGGAQGLWRIAISGSGGAQRLAVGENGFNPSISRQGNRLVYSQSISDSNIWRVNLSDPREQPVQLIASTRGESNGQYSPDGKKIVFASNRSGNMEVWICDADGSSPVQVTSTGYSGAPRWSPDSQRIAFDSNVSGHWQIYTVSARGGQARRMTNGPTNDTRPSWSHDGKWIYFGSDRSVGGWQIWKVPAGGGEPVQVTTKGGYNPFESEDGKTIYHTTNSPTSPLWSVPADGGEPTQIADSVPGWAFSVARDGVYFIAGRELKYFSLATSESKPILTIQKPTSLGMSVSPDEHWLLYSQIDQGGSDLMLVENFH
jgi:Tol biopolymer transport system component